MLREALAEAENALLSAIDLRVKLFRHGDAEGETDDWPDARVANKDKYAREWSAAIAKIRSVT